MFKNPFREIDIKNRKNSSDLLKQVTNFNKVVNQRVSHLMMIVLCIFIVISSKLAYVQLFQQEDYLAKLEAFTKKQQVITPPRGEMFDRNGNLLVANEECLNITYYPPNNVSSYSSSKWRLAYEFANRFNVSNEDLTLRDWKDFYLLMSDDNGNSLLNENEFRLSSSEIYSLKLSRITQELIDEMIHKPLSEQDAVNGKMSNYEYSIAWPVMQLMEMATTNHSSVVIEKASNEDVAYLVEHKSDFPGFDVVADWNRSYPYGATIRDILGSVSTRGLDAVNQDYYLAQGYALNERVGASGLELQYEDYLNGTRTVMDINYDDESGLAVFTPSSIGKKGYDLTLTIDIELQQKIDQIIIDTIEAEKDNKYRKNFKQAYITLMNPQNGEIYAMSGQVKQEDGSYLPYASANYLSAFPDGSVVKLATLFMGLNEGVVTPGEIILDAPMVFVDGTRKASATNKGLINDIEAIAESSNIYMFHIALRMGGSKYVANQPMAQLEKTAFDVFRKYYGMFGLGVKTGIDIPYEEVGYYGSTRTSSNLLDFSIGQYDTYTPIQLLQYVAMVGNGGYRVQPHFLKSVSEINSEDSVIYQFKTKVLNTLSGNPEYLQRVVEGMRECVNTGFCGTSLKAMDKEIAAKTGTAEVSTEHILTNSAIIGFAPSENPTVAFVCSAPLSNNDVSQPNICISMIEKSLKEYYKIYE